jgi:hypothetical protein
MWFERGQIHAVHRSNFLDSFPLKGAWVMTGEVIQFARHRDFKTEHQYRQKPAPQGTAPDIRSAGIVEFRVARITRLVTELEGLTRLFNSVPSTTLDRARADLEKARRIVRPLTADRQQLDGEDAEGDPQPDLDDERLERMYRLLNQDV